MRIRQFILVEYDLSYDGFVGASHKDTFSTTECGAHLLANTLCSKRIAHVVSRDRRRSAFHDPHTCSWL